MYERIGRGRWERTSLASFLRKVFPFFSQENRGGRVWGWTRMRSVSRVKYSTWENPKPAKPQVLLFGSCSPHLYYVYSLLTISISENGGDRCLVLITQSCD